MNLLIQRNEPNLTCPNIAHKFEEKVKREQLVRVTMCDHCDDGGGMLHQAFATTTVHTSSSPPFSPTYSSST